MKQLTSAAFVVLALFASAGTAHAQTNLGLYAGFNTTSDDAYIGGNLRSGFGGNPNLFLYPSVDVYFIEDVTFLIFHGNIGYRFRPQSVSLEPYAGGGVSFRYVSSNSRGRSDGEVDVNLNAGVVFNRRSATRPFIELRLLLGETNNTLVQGGVLFSL